MRSSWLKGCLAALLVIGFAARVHAIGSLSNDFHRTRQYNTASMVRPAFLETQPDTPAWQLHIARLNQPPQLEPPVIQSVALLGYQLAGAEILAIPRTFSALMWVIGGLFVYLLARRIMGGGGALVAAAFYLYAPFGLAASRSFQVNPTMIGLSVIADWAIVRYFEQPTRQRLIAAILAAAAAIFTLIYAAFMIFPLFGWLALRRDGLRGALQRPHYWAFAILSLLPSALYYLYGLTIGGFLAGQTGALFNPRLWLLGDYYVDWLGRVLVVIGLLPLLLSIQALVMARGLAAAVLRSLWLGYILFGLTFNWPVSSHDYYTLPLIPIAGLSLGSAADFILRRLPARRPLWQPAGALLLTAIITGYGLAQYLPTTAVTPRQERDVAAAVEIGARLEHSDKIIYLTDDYGSLLTFHGLLAGINWPNQWDLYAALVAGRPMPRAEERLSAWLDSGGYQYFVVTSFDEWEKQPELAALLRAQYPLLAETDAYLIFDLRPDA